MSTRSSGSLQDRREVPDAEPPAVVVYRAGYGSSLKSGNRSPLRQLSFLIAENSMRELGDSNDHGEDMAVILSVSGRYGWRGSGNLISISFCERSPASEARRWTGIPLEHNEEAPARWRGLLLLKAAGFGADTPRRVVFPNLSAIGRKPDERRRLELEPTGQDHDASRDRRSLERAVRAAGRRDRAADEAQTASSNII